MQAARRSTITFLSDYGPGDEYVGVVEAVIASIAPDTRVIHLAAKACRPGRARPDQDGSRGRCGSRRPASTSRSSIRVSAPRGEPSRSGRRTGSSSAPTTACWSKPPKTSSTRWSRSADRPTGSSLSRARSTAATSSPPSPRTSPSVSRWRACRSIRRASFGSTHSNRARDGATRIVHVVEIDGFGNLIARRRPARRARSCPRPRPRGRPHVRRRSTGRPRDLRGLRRRRRDRRQRRQRG